ncbi:hypothetical protein Theam_1741 (plasmid) [Thermovibrio ammonificans HB-1]|uniref:Uncharacterized protein n=1 Tax=Thermovibrio ammonificans (strain DSM 15698 / JCM 12110 / HB-1) TaxID=648996 RepID=E8T6X6_THEA1|nr:hypothetical protein [Thermovibrio ammonificans]ADU97697.1 hypothetical protein Theam_1741 [Thermovibrio ammonificans HB-1]
MDKKDRKPIQLYIDAETRELLSLVPKGFKSSLVEALIKWAFSNFDREEILQIAFSGELSDPARRNEAPPKQERRETPERPKPARRPEPEPKTDRSSSNPLKDIAKEFEGF